MNLITPKKNERLKLIAKVKAEYSVLMEIPGAMKTAIYNELALKYKKTEFTIRKYLSK